MSITLSEQEAVAIVEALDGYLPELRYELARVKLERDRHELVQREEVLTELRRRLAERLVGASAPL